MVLGVLVVAFVLRVAVVNAWDSYEPVADGLHYHRLATSLSEGNGWGESLVPAASGPTAFRAPGYPALLAAVYVVAGSPDLTAGRLANAILGVVIVALVGVLGWQLFDRRVALVAMGLAAIHPGMIIIATPIALEPLLVVLTLGSLAAALEHRRAPHGWKWPMLSGALLGLAILTREIGFLLIPPLAWLLLSPGHTSEDTPASPLRRRAAAPIIAVLVAAAVVVPWTIRNWVELNAFVPVSTSSGIGLAGSYNETSRTDEETPGQWIAPWADPEMAEIILANPDATEITLDRDLTRASLDIIAEHPTYPLEVGFWNFVRMFDLDGGEYSRFISQFFPYPARMVGPAVIAGWLVLAMAIAGAFTRAARRVPKGVWLILALFVPFMVVALPGSLRYRASLEPFFVLLASSWLVAMGSRLLANHSSSVAPRRA